MKKHILLASVMLLSASAPAVAQRVMDVLDRGLVAVRTDGGVFCSWRIPGEEWYDVEYNIYRDGTKLNTTPLTVSNYLDRSGSASSHYTVSAIVRGVEQSQCKQVSVLEKNYMTIVPKHDPSLTSTYVPNDACCADVDGDGVVEILMKYDNESEISASFPYGGHNGEYSLFECLKLDGTVLWWVNCGPNMGDFQNNEQNIVGYDWDGDGKAEVVFRAADGTTIHMANGEVYTVGDPTLNYRGATGGGANWFMHAGAEYLLYVDGATGKPYQCLDYPLPRLDADENPNGLLSGGAYDSLVNSAWGDGYGHRSTKHFFGAPYLDGRKPSIFLARGIYTRHKMVAYDVDPATHQLVERWRWKCYEPGIWYGQGYHNYSVADVDWDGRDEIVFGSMVIDDNGRGLSSTGLGHGDSHHVGDFDPYTFGQEIFACNEDSPNNNFRDATTSKIYYRTTGGNDDGRANMGNFIDEYPGAQGVSSRDDNLVGGASHEAIIGDKKANVSITQNFRIYWDGDLCDETFDYNSGKNSQGAIFKARQGKIHILEGSRTNNDTKGTPCYQGDIFGDWREEVIMRDASNNIRIYTTNIETPWRLYSLWHDHQYRNAMVWQMCGYNQTPHVSYFVGEFEGITVPPAPLTMTGRTEVVDNGTIGKDLDGKHLIMCQTGDMTVNVAEGAAPYILTVNAPSWVQGSDNNARITYQYFTHNLKGGALTGEMRLVKQGEGRLVMDTNDHTYSGATELWGGETVFDGHLVNSPVWVNRLARLTSNGGRFDKGIDMHYGSVMTIGNNEAASQVSTDVLKLGFGAIVEVDLFPGVTSDKIVANKLVIEKKDWLNGPKYLNPVLRLNTAASTLESGVYVIGEIGSIEGDLNDLLIEGLDNYKKIISYADGKLCIEIKVYEGGTKQWSGQSSTMWDFDNSLNFLTPGQTELTSFVPGDEVTFDDSAVNTDVVISGDLMPKSVTFANDTKAYSLSGDGAIIGDASLTVKGAAPVTINNVNRYTGTTYIDGGKLIANSFANNIGTEYGSVGPIGTQVRISNGGILSTNANNTMGNRITITQGHAGIEIPSGVTLTLANGINSVAPGAVITKTGAGKLIFASGNTFTKLVIDGGSVESRENSSSQQAIASTVEFIKGNLYDESNIYSYSNNSTNFIVATGNSGSLYLDARCNYTGKLTGGGALTVYAASVRNELQGNWSEFEGVVTAGYMARGSSYDPDFIWSNDYGLPKGTLNIPAGITVNAGSHKMPLGNLTGTGVLNCSSEITLGNSDKDISYNGTFGGNPAVVKVGAGDWKVAKAIATVRSITVREGTMSLAASNTSLNVSAAKVTLQENGLLRGRGTLTSLEVKDGGVFEPGYYSSNSPVHYGVVAFTEDVNIGADGVLSMYLRAASGSNPHSSIKVDGKLTINGVIKVGMYEKYEPKVGDSFALWTAGSFAGTPASIELPELPDGLGWDDSGLRDGSGVLRVIETVGIVDIAADADAVCTVYTADGVAVGQIETTPATAIADIRKHLGLTGGMYILRMAGQSNTVTVKIVL